MRVLELQVPEHEPQLPHVVHAPSTERVKLIFSVVRENFECQVIMDSTDKALLIYVQFDPYFDSFLFHLKLQCKACYHYKALNVFLYLYCKSLSMCPKHPMLSTRLQLKTAV